MRHTWRITVTKRASTLSAAFLFYVIGFIQIKSYVGLRDDITIMPFNDKENTFNPHQAP